MMGSVKVLAAGIKYGWRAEMAFFLNSMIKNVGALSYTAAFLLFFGIVYANIDDIAGYGTDEMLLLMLFGQLSFYSYAAFAGRINEKIAFGIHKGALDFHLLRPRSALMSIWSESISIGEFVRTLPVVIIIGLAIDWRSLDIYLPGLLLGIVVLVVGVVLYWAIQFIFSCTSFWTGQSSKLLYMIFTIDSQVFPLRGLNGAVRFMLLYLAPVVVKSSLVAALALGDISLATGLQVVVAASVWIFGLSWFVWRQGLRRYTSASS